MGGKEIGETSTVFSLRSDGSEGRPFPDRAGLEGGERMVIMTFEATFKLTGGCAKNDSH